MADAGHRVELVVDERSRVFTTIHRLRSGEVATPPQLILAGTPSVR